jgi:3-polyprenyl-4-hydroxybenzoate decarboxylase
MPNVCSATPTKHHYWSTHYNRIKGGVPGVKVVHLPNSGIGRFNCYISIDKRVDGESKQGALIAPAELLP